MQKDAALPTDKECNPPVPAAHISVRSTLEFPPSQATMPRSLPPFQWSNRHRKLCNRLHPRTTDKRCRSLQPRQTAIHPEDHVLHRSELPAPSATKAWDTQLSTNCKCHWKLRSRSRNCS